MAARWRRYARFKWDALRSVIADVAGGPPLRGNGQDDDAERDHRQSHKFKYQRVHDKPPTNRHICRGIEPLLIFDREAWRLCFDVERQVNDSRSAKRLQHPL